MDLQQLETAFKNYQTNTQISDLQEHTRLQKQIDSLQEEIKNLKTGWQNHENWLNLVDRAIKTLRAETESRAKIAPQSLQTKENPKKTWLWW